VQLLLNKLRTNNRILGFSIDAVAGALASLALPPVFFVTAIFIIAVPAWRAIHAPHRQAAAGVFFGAGLGWFLASTYWVAHSLLVAAPALWFLTPAVALALAVVLAAFWALAAGLSWTADSTALVRLLRLIVLFAMLEWARSFVATGFPWNLMGSLFAVHITSVQMASIVGIYGLTLLAFGCAMAPLFWCLGRWWAALLCLLLPLLGTGFGSARLAAGPSLDAAITPGNAPLVRLVQPSVPQSEKWNRQKRADHLARLVALSRHGTARPAVVIWPETAFAGLPHQNQNLLAGTAGAATSDAGYLLTGIPRFNGDGHPQNSAFLLDQNGALRGLYDKRHLVPFGEYVPFRSLLPFLDIIAGPADFVAGTQNRMITVPHVGKVQMLICYEVIFAGRVVDPERRPDVMVNITNDAWFGKTIGPWQHLYQAQLRAVEEGVPLLRVANTGITAAFDGYGRQLGVIPLGDKAYLDITVPSVLTEPVFARWGNGLFFVMCLVIAMIARGVDHRQYVRNR